MKKIPSVCLILLALHLSAFAQREKLKAVYVNGRWGYADHSGKVVIPAHFDAARPFIDGLAQVGVLNEELPELEARPNIKWGYIDETGRIVVELRYTVLHGFSEDVAAAAVLDAERPERPARGRGSRLNLRWGYVDKRGREIIPMQFLAAGDFAEGLAHVNSGGDNGEGSLCGPSPNYGYIDKTGSFVIKPQFTRASPFQQGRARVSVGRIIYAGRCLCCNPRFSGTHGSVDRSGTFIADKPTDGEATLEEDWEDQ